MNEFILPLRVYIEDTDAGGIVYYVNYLKFMERARTEFMRHCGFDKNWIFSSDRMFVVHALKADYKGPAVLDDELKATAKPIKKGKAYIVFQQQIFRGNTLLCDGEVKIVCVDRGTGLPTAIPKVMWDKIDEYNNDKKES